MQSRFDPLEILRRALKVPGGTVREETLGWGVADFSSDFLDRHYCWGRLVKALRRAFVERRLA